MTNNKIFYFISIAVWACFLCVVLATPAKSNDAEVVASPPTIEEIKIQLIIASSDLDKPAEEPVTFEQWFRENASVINDCEITHYCCEPRKHICGTGDGITATGVPVTPWWTCAVDPSVIPYGSEVMVDYGDRVEFWMAQDCGGSVKGAHVDLAVPTHAEALELGVKKATVYWMEESCGID